LLDVMANMKEAGADIGKIVVMASDVYEVRVPMSLYQVAYETDFDLVAFSMGEHGRISRLMALVMGAPFTFAAPDNSAGTAPGQIEITKMKRLLAQLL
jgi:3-dehydroquinate dehydratase type I